MPRLIGAKLLKQIAYGFFFQTLSPDCVTHCLCPITVFGNLIEKIFLAVWFILMSTHSTTFALDCRDLVSKGRTDADDAVFNRNNFRQFVEAGDMKMAETAFDWYESRLESAAKWATICNSFCKEQPVGLAIP